MCVDYLRTEFEKIAVDVYNLVQLQQIAKRFNPDKKANRAKLTKNKSFKPVILSNYHLFKSFKSIPQDNIARDNNGHAIPCPDQFVGVLKVETDKVSWVESRPAGGDECYNVFNDEISKKDINNTIAIVIESPHTHEFSKENALGPAIGDTGCKLLGYLPGLIYKYILKNPKKIQNDCYKVYLINSIQYQCSLGEVTFKYRDKIFSRMWKLDKVKNNFINRLKHSKPSVIINCCTRGNFNRSQEKLFLRNLVKNTINEFLQKQSKNILCLRAVHPSVWYFENELSCCEKK